MHKLNSITSVYDRMYTVLATTPIFHEITQSVLGEKYVPQSECFSYIDRDVLNQVADEIVTRKITGSVLDLGCGNGGLTRHLSKLINLPMFGIDLSSVAINYGKSLAQKTNTEVTQQIELTVGNFGDTPYHDNMFGAVVAFDSIQNAVSYVETAYEISRILQPNGIFLYTNWMQKHIVNFDDRQDPLHSKLREFNFEIETCIDIDPGMKKQFKIFSEIYSRRNEFKNELGAEFVLTLMAEAKHLWSMKENVSHHLTIARKIPK